MLDAWVKTPLGVGLVIDEKDGTVLVQFGAKGPYRRYECRLITVMNDRLFQPPAWAPLFEGVS